MYFESRLKNNIFDRINRSRDASYYEIMPKSVCFPENRRDILALFDYSRRSRRSVTFRAAGTSLSGQALGNDIIADISRNWQDFSYNPYNETITAQASVIAGRVNEYLSKFGRMIGPDPASINSATIAGICSNNSSGMSSGIVRNPYSTVLSMTYILPDGAVIDSNMSDSFFKDKHPILYNSIQEIRDKILNDNELVNIIKSNYEVKNVIGYSLNSFIDFFAPIDILTHLMIGSEGTLGFIEKATLKTFKIKPVKHTILLAFNDLEASSKAINSLLPTKPESMEIMDAIAVKSVGKLPEELTYLNDLNDVGAVFLIEYGFDNSENNIEKNEHIYNIINNLTIFGKAIVANSPELREKLWFIRRGILASIGGNRPKGTSIVIEDIAIPQRNFANAISELRQILDNYSFTESAIFGHCLDGNIHFLLPVDFSKSFHINRFEQFTNNLITFVKSQKGSLKAEHGTGRSMAPFVINQWGQKAYEIMREIKSLIDPDGMLNPDVILSNDNSLHIKDLKHIPQKDSLIDKCIECGFCEHICPSRNLTFTPRHRIVSFRKDTHDAENFQYLCLDTCAVDGLCETVCPIGINVGNFVKSERSKRISNNTNRLANSIIKYGKISEILLSSGIKSSNIVSKAISVKYFNRLLSLSTANIAWSSYIGNPININNLTSKQATAVYYPCCISRLMGKDDDKTDIIHTFTDICQTAGIKIKMPRNLKGQCCGMAFGSKGLKLQQITAISNLVEELFEASMHGNIPIVFDSSSCWYSFKYQSVIEDEAINNKWKKLRILDSYEFIEEYILKRLKLYKLDSIALHINCSVRKSGNAERLINFCKSLSNNIFTPNDKSCCGYAGDRGITHPELYKSAIQPKILEYKGLDFDGYYSTNIPCQTALSDGTGNSFQSIFHLIKKCLKS